MLNKSGIYKITCDPTGKFYIGSAVSFKKRWCSHVSTAELGRHHNRHFQSAWTKHGKDAFRFEPLLVCKKDDLLMYEQRAIDFLKPNFI